MKAFIPCICAAGLGLALFASAAPSSDGSGAGGGSIRSRIIEKLRGLRSDLNLTDTQRGEIKKILVSHRDEIRNQWQSGKTAREGMREAVTAHGADSAESKAAAAHIGESARDRALLVARIATEIKPLLTADQVSKLQSTRTDIEGMIDEAASK